MVEEAQARVRPPTSSSRDRIGNAAKRKRPAGENPATDCGGHRNQQHFREPGRKWHRQRKRGFRNHLSGRNYIARTDLPAPAYVKITATLENNI